METLRVGAAFPDPPFNGMPDDAGLDIDLMTAHRQKARRDSRIHPLRRRRLQRHLRRPGLRRYDCVTAGTTVTPEREKKAKFVPPYLISGQSLAVDTTRLPHVTSIDDLEGLTIGVQQGNTSQPIADRLVAEGKAAAVRVYDYGSIRTALTDLTTGACDAFMKLAPVLTELVKPIPGVEGGPARHLGREHRDRRRARRPGAPRPHHRRAGRTGRRRHAAAHPPEMAG